MKTFGEKLKSYAVFKGGVGKFAEDIGVSQSHLSSYTTGKKAPGKEILERIKKTGCDMNWLLDDTNHDDYVTYIEKQTQGDKYEANRIEELTAQLKEMEIKYARAVVEREELREENEELRDQSARIAATEDQIDKADGKRLKKK